MIFPRRRTTNSYLFLIRLALVVAGASLLGHARAENVILYLKSGDKITGFVVSEYTNRLVLSNNWVKDLSVPLKEIEKREITAVPGTNRLAGTNLVAKLKAQAKLTQPPAPKLFKYWKGEAEVGLDVIYNTANQQTYHGRFTLSYERPYASDSKRFFRNTTDFSVEYGKIEQKVNGVRQTVASSDKMGASDKTSFDITRRWYSYNLVGVGDDLIQNIRLRVEEGPGMGYHLLTLTNWVVNLEGGVDYQVQNNTDDTHTRDFFYRIAEDVNWKINPRTTLVEKAEFFPRVDFSEYRLRAELTLSYNLWRYVYVNTTVRDSYDTRPVVGAEPNELEIHSALGVKF
ncbi:MAG TPA: DUF481 domain-containing protein [Verrucomicrobiae bacterium]|jgi:hypothetical protein|nr:DUF481 domain-containing protein [Verrucomicrobiae bacterium]